MTPGQLVKAVALALDVPEETVVQHDRNLAVAGLRTTGARGRNAPDVTPLDAARLLVATLASIRVKDSVDSVRAFEKTEFDPPRSEAEKITEWRAHGMEVPESDRPLDTNKFSDPAIMALPAKHNLIDAIAALVSDSSLPVANLEEHLERFAPLMIACEAPWPRAFLFHMEQLGSHASYRKPVKADNQSSGEWARVYGIRQKRDVYGTAIMLLGRAFRENGLNFKTTKEALADFLPIEAKPVKLKKRKAG